jgi:hypothetical protein
MSYLFEYNPTNLMIAYSQISSENLQGYCSIVFQNHEYFHLILYLEKINDININDDVININLHLIHFNNNYLKNGPIILRIPSSNYVSKLVHISQLIGPLQNQSVSTLIHYIKNNLIYLKIQTKNSEISSVLNLL